MTSKPEDPNMPRMSLVDPAATTGKVADAFENLPTKLNIFRMMAHAETCMVPQVRLGGSILGRQDLSHQHREMLILLVAQLEGGAYEWKQHVPIAEGVGVSKEQITAIEHEHLTSEVFDESELALLAFGRQVIESVRVDDATFAAMRQHFSEREVVEAILAIGFYMTMARLTEVTETELDPAAGITILDANRPQPSNNST
jgi:alkylhydroperoxidase family enzyme